jgi:hypothetical protein
VYILSLPARGPAVPKFKNLPARARKAVATFLDYAVIMILHAAHICLLSNGQTMGREINEPENCFAIGM